MEQRSELTTEEIVKALRKCKDTACEDCFCYKGTHKKSYCYHPSLADRLESQQREIERLQTENHAMYRERMESQHVFIPDGNYEIVMFFGVPIADALNMVERYPDACAERDAEKARADAAVADMKNCCHFCANYDCEGDQDPCNSCMCVDHSANGKDNWMWRGEKGKATE